MPQLSIEIFDHALLHVLTQHLVFYRLLKSCDQPQFLLSFPLFKSLWISVSGLCRPAIAFIRNPNTTNWVCELSVLVSTNSIIMTGKQNGAGQTVCVTGAGGFIASWLVKLLLERGYNVRGTVRNPEDQKNAHLRQLEGAEERLTLVKADLMDYDSLLNAINGCQGVFHVASPVTDDPVQMVEPAVNGTKNVLDACAEAGVRRVVFTSSIGAVYMDPNRDYDALVDESCWSNLDFCKDTKNWYCYGKAVAEQAAWERAKEKGLDLVVVNPCVVLGPVLQASINASILHILKYLTGSAKTYANSVQAYVHVRDVAEAHILVFESPSASGRYLCAESVLHRGDVVDLLKMLFPQYPIPTKCKDDGKPRMKPWNVSNQKLKDLGLEFTPAKQCLYETVISLQEKGHIPK